MKTICTWICTIAVLLLAAGCAMISTGSSRTEPGALCLWYRQPATNWMEALPVGNGRVGAMIFGGVAQEQLQLNEDSLWSGAPQDADNPEALQALPEIRRLLFEGKYAEAQILANGTLICKGRGSARGRGARAAYGSYQTLGDLKLDFGNGTNGVFTNYIRTLDLDSAVAGVSYQCDGVRFEREVFASYPDQVLVMRLAANKPGALNFTATLSRPEAAEVSAAGPNELLMHGQLWSGTNWDGMKYAARLRVINTGGEVATNGPALQVKGADNVVLLFAAATDYRMQLPDWRQGDPQAKTGEQINAAAAKSYRQLKSAHVADYRKLFRRVRLDLGGTGTAKLPTDERLRAVAAGGKDPALTALYFQYGRYLMISSSRPGSMPANLQGLWCHTIQSPWNCDYHANINLQMLYWPVDVANLEECFEPFERYVEFLTGPGARTAKVHYGARGWTVHTLANVWGFTSPSESPAWGLSPSAGAWLSQNLWDHFAFWRDTNYLRRVLPVLRGSAEFTLDWLVENPTTGKLVAGPAPSPENRFIAPDGQQVSLCMGPAVEQEIAWDAFNNYLSAVRVLKTDEPTVLEVKKAQVQLAGLHIGKDGRLMEWPEEFPEVEPGHRHIAHLFALHPGREITLRGTPELAAAARKSMEFRLAHGSGHTGWSRAWIVNFWARLGEGDLAWENLQTLLARSTQPNLLDTHPPFQLDGNCGGTVGICEMLLQSHAGEIQLLPALPKAWPTGSVKGLRARGGYELDIAWRDGRLASVTVRNKNGRARCRMRYRDKLVTVSVAPGKSKTLDGNLSSR